MPGPAVRRRARERRRDRAGDAVVPGRGRDTGAYFDLFVLIANPGEHATRRSRRPTCCPTAPTIAKTLHGGRQQPLQHLGRLRGRRRLADTAVSTTIRSTNGVPVIVERALWWPGTFGQWYEAHNSPGATPRARAGRWPRAKSAARADVETYILLANTSRRTGDRAGDAAVRRRRPARRRTFTVAARSRFNVDVRRRVPGGARQALRRHRREPRHDARADRRRAGDVLGRRSGRSGRPAPTRWRRSCSRGHVFHCSILQDLSPPRHEEMISCVAD